MIKLNNPLPSNNTVVGLDISDRTIELVELAFDGEKATIINKSRTNLPQGIVEKNRIKDASLLQKELLKTFAKAKPAPILVEKKIIFGWPESLTFIHITEVKNANPDELKVQAKKETLKNIPIKENELSFDFKIISQDAEKVRLLLIAAKRSVIEEWQNFFNQLKLDIAWFDFETIATYRGLSLETQEPVCIVDIGANTSTISIFSQNNLYYAHSLEFAGTKITNDISQDLNLSIESAEKIKTTEGLSKPASQIFPIIIKTLEPIAHEIKAGIEHFNQFVETPVQKVILVGGTSKLKKLKTYFETNLELDIALGKTKLKSDSKRTSYFEYIEAIGLALRGFNNHWSKDDPKLPFIKNAQPESPSTSKQDTPNKEHSHINVSAVVKKIQQIPSPKFRMNKKIWLILGCVLIIIFLALNFTNLLTLLPSRPADLELQPITLPNEQSLRLQIPVATEPNLYTKDRVSARTVTFDFLNEVTLKPLIDESYYKLKRELAANEQIWANPLLIDEKENQVTWLVYQKADLLPLVTQNLRAKNPNGNTYEVINYAITGVEETENEALYYFVIAINLYTNKIIPTEEEITPTPEIVPTKPAQPTPSPTTTIIVIKDTSTGWLNVRSGPGIYYEQITKVYPQQEFELLGINGEWSQIKLSDGAEGWIYSNYAQLKQ